MRQFGISVTSDSRRNASSSMMGTKAASSRYTQAADTHKQQIYTRGVMTYAPGMGI